MAVYLGIDIASKKFDAAMLCEGSYRCRTFDNSSAGFKALLNWTDGVDVSEIHACLEATGNYGTALATFLYEKEFKVSVVNPARVRGFAAAEMSRTKTDKADSKLIARFCKAANPALWKPVPESLRKLQALVRRVNALNGMLRMECNRAGQADESVRASLRRITEHLEQEIKIVRHEIQKHIDSHNELKIQHTLICSVPGIGVVTGAVILSFIADKKFSKAKEAAAFLGLNPRQHQSGSSVRGKTRMSKQEVLICEASCICLPWLP